MQLVERLPGCEVVQAGMVKWILVTWALHERRIDMQLSLEVIVIRDAAIELQRVL